jgi:hypothetical protein
MPNNSSARRDKEKKKNRHREPPPPEKQVPAEGVESFLSRSSADSGFQEGDDKFTWESAAGEAALDNSLSSFSWSSLSAEPKGTRKEERARKTREELAKELDEESDINLSDEDFEVKDSGSRKLSLSPTQFLESKVLGSLRGSIAMQQRAMERLSALTAPIQVLDAKGKEASADVPVEAVACVVASDANSIQRDNQGHPHGSSSVSPPSPSFNLPPTEHAQALNRNLAAELILAGSGRSPSLSSRVRYPQEPGTVVSMIAPTAARRNNLISSVQVQADHRTVDELRVQAQTDNRTVDVLRDKLQRFGDACELTVREARGAVEQAQAETARLRQVAAVGERVQVATELQMLEQDQEQTLAATQLRSEEDRNERRRLKEVATATRPTPIEPVIDMRFCIDNLASLRIEGADHSLTDFSDYWAPDFPKTTPNRPNTFVPNHLLRGSNPLWAPFFDPGLSRQDADGSLKVDPSHPPFFRVSQEVLGRALHTFKRKYVDDDFRRKTDKDLSEHINAVTSNVKEGVANAARLLNVTECFANILPTLSDIISHYLTFNHIESQ